MIKLIADNHGFDTIGELLNYEPKSSDDLLLLLGDTCLKMADTEEYNKFSDWLLSRKYNIAIVDGNHENYEYLNSCPEEIWNGGKVNRITENIVRLKRGEIFNIEGHSFFALGGCDSSAKWKAKGLWHPGDIPSREEITNCYTNLAKADFKVDYIVSHKYYCNECHVNEGEETYELFALNKFIDKNVEFKRWFSGHRHQDYEIDVKHRVLFNKVIDLY